MFSAKVRRKSKSLSLKVVVSFLVVLLVVVLGPGLLKLDSSQALAKKKGKKICNATAKAASKACQNERMDDYWIALGNCKNLSDPDEKADCLSDAKDEKKEAKEECRDQKEARLEVCQELGQAVYDPQLDPADFLTPSQIAADPNPYFPLVPGTVWEYEAKDAGGTVIELITVEVTDETKDIEYKGQIFTCIVVRDVVTDPDDEVIEFTKDWYGQDEDGNVWYMGEIARDFELDLDGKPELVEIEGSWKAGKDFAKPGILMEADPQPDDIYRQEFALGDAEDMGEVISRDEESVTVPFNGGTTFDDDVVQTKDWTPIEPEVFELKYYAPGIGRIKEEYPETGERVELVEMTTP
jgi:hypothetical protein